MLDGFSDRRLSLQGIPKVAGVSRTGPSKAGEVPQGCRIVLWQHAAQNLEDLDSARGLATNQGRRYQACQGKLMKSPPECCLQAVDEPRQNLQKPFQDVSQAMIIGVVDACCRATCYCGHGVAGRQWPPRRPASAGVRPSWPMQYSSASLRACYVNGSELPRAAGSSATAICGGGCEAGESLSLTTW